MDVFELRNRLVDDYASYVKSFIQIQDERVAKHVHEGLDDGLLWPEPLIQLNPSFEPGGWVDDLVEQGVLHAVCSQVFRKDKDRPECLGDGRRLRLHQHQEEAIRVARGGHNYVLTTGTGSGKSLTYIVPIVDHVLRRGSGRGIQAIVIYPMNALANSQFGELEKFLCYGFPNRQGPVTFARYTGQETDEQRQQIIANPPDILLTNYVMLELILTRPVEKPLIQAAQGLRFLVLDELHTYRGRQGADVALLVRRVRDRLGADNLQCVGTSATLAGAGSYEEARAEVAAVATQLFGAMVEPQHVVGETVRRATPARDSRNPQFVHELSRRVGDSNCAIPADFQSFVNDSLSIWIETTFGVTTEPGTGRLIRATPRSISGEEGAAKDLSELTGVPLERCEKVIEEGLLDGYRWHNPETNFPVFAFRLHQFISRGDTVYASLEPEADRHVTVHGQQFVPGSRNKILLPLVFCRECGAEYYAVRQNKDPNTGQLVFAKRELNDQMGNDESKAGYLYFSTDDPWPRDPEAIAEKVPEDWLEEHRGSFRVRPGRRGDLPVPVSVGTNGQQHPEGLECHFLPAPFRFCLHCGVSYDARQGADFAKLTSLNAGGRSTATTILSLSAIRNLQQEESLPPEARKLLSFTDNRQDASLQAGHFNDFIEIGTIRAALYRAVKEAGENGVTHEELTQKVFNSLGLPLDQYASNPQVRFAALTQTQRALRDVLGYRLYRDLKRGWRVTSPNLEQCGLLEIQYLSLLEVCQAEDLWEKRHLALVTAKPETRAKVAKVLLDYMRRELAIKVDYLNMEAQERIQAQSSLQLLAPWAIDENERMEYAGLLLPRSRRLHDSEVNVYLSPRSGFGLFLRRSSTFPDFGDKLNLADTEEIIGQLLEILSHGGLVEAVMLPDGADAVPGYQLPASALLWTAGDGSQAFHDPIRVPSESTVGRRTNPFFVHFYREIAADLWNLRAREHTAQVQPKVREEREEAFREGRLPILYCSPTMELGIDIASLNVVNLRNVPPTPANYAQRSGRAGRSGQPALIFSYCTTGSPHDQYFFKRPGLMVAGAVRPPRLDMANEDLSRAHVQAIWLAETGLSLGKSLKDVLDVSGVEPTLALHESVKYSIEAPTPRQRALERAKRVLSTVREELLASDWYSEKWLDEALAQVTRHFDLACGRWRNLYHAALSQAKAQDRIIRDATRSVDDRRQADRLRREAEAQLALLTSVENVYQSDFYSYRYFASEGFLPGYSFPRLPLSAYLPGRKTASRDEFISRPRFLAISEFGPQAIVYHEGSRFVINKVILPVEEDGVLTHRAKRCEKCGYLHPIFEGEGPDLCEHCHAPLGTPYTQLFRLQNVATKRRDRINCDEEERMRLGYEIITSVRFAEHGSGPSFRTATIEQDGEKLGTLTYGHAATLWRVNLGWSRRKKQDQYGFVLDTERGYWQKSEQAGADDGDDPMSPRTSRVIPYVEDRRNCLLFEPQSKLGDKEMASLQSALHNAIRVHYQLEDGELASELLPNHSEHRLILFFESAEGGAGVLRRLLDDSQALAAVTKDALRICHFDPETGEDLRRPPRAREDCEAACYDCLMSYSNQRDHTLLDRQAIRDYLLDLAQARVDASPGEVPRAAHLEMLMRQAGSELERKWLRHLEENGHHLPSKAQELVASCSTRPDFLYEEAQVAVYIDGPFHDYPERHSRDMTKAEALEDRGYVVIRFVHDGDWATMIARYPHVFGRSA